MYEPDIAGGSSRVQFEVGILCWISIGRSDARRGTHTRRRRYTLPLPFRALSSTASSVMPGVDTVVSERRRRVFLRRDVSSCYDDSAAGQPPRRSRSP